MVSQPKNILRNFHPEILGGIFLIAMDSYFLMDLGWIIFKISLVPGLDFMQVFQLIWRPKDA